MSSMTIKELSLVFQDLLVEKETLLAQTTSYVIFKSGVIANGAKLLDYAKSEDKLPLAEELRIVDGVHDDTARAVHHYCRVMKKSGLLSDARIKLLDTVLETFVPNLAFTRARYEEEAAGAHQKREALNQLEPQLTPFLIAPELSMYEALDAHVSAAEKIGELLSNRATQSQQQNAAKDKDAAIMRVKAIGLLNRLQGSIESEVEFNDLDPELPGRIFAYWEQMQSRSNNKSANETETPADQ